MYTHVYPESVNKHEISKRSSHPSTSGVLIGNSETSTYCCFASFWKAEIRKRNHILWVFSSNNQCLPLYGRVFRRKGKWTLWNLRNIQVFLFPFQDFLQTMACAQWVLAISECPCFSPKLSLRQQRNRSRNRWNLRWSFQKQRQNKQMS